MNPETQNIEKNMKGDGRKKLLIGILVFVIVFLLSAVGVMAFLLGKSSNDQVLGDETEPKRAVITAENVDEVLAEMKEESEENKNIPKSYTVTQNSEWIYENGSSPTINAYVENDASNETPVYFDLVIDETGEVIYSSPVLELGASISNLPLDKPIEAGSYVCTVVYHLIDDEQNELTTVNVGVTLTVEN